MVVSLNHLDHFFASLCALQAVSELPDGVAITVDLSGEGGGTWTVVRRGGGAELHQPSAAEAGLPVDCKLACSVSDFRALMRRQLDFREAFLAGRVEVRGDVGLVLKLRRITQAVSAD